MHFIQDCRIIWSAGTLTFLIHAPMEPLTARRDELSLIACVATL